MARDRSRPPEPAPVHEFHFSDVQRSTLANGLTVLSAQHGSLPVVTLTLLVHAGAECDDRAHAGLAQLTANALEAGTRTRSADRLAWEFEMLGAELDVSVGWDAAQLSATVPAQHAEAALGLLAEVATNPAFAEDEVERLVAEQLAELEQRRADPGSLASDSAVRFIFAPDVPYARPIVGTTASVKHLTATHVRAFYEQHWVPGNAALIVVGDLPANQIRDMAARQLEGWQQSALTRADFDVATTIERAQIFIVDRPDSVQSELRVGHLGLARATPDYFAVTIANGVLGGVFTSRLNMSLREEHGFTYGVRSGFGFRKQPGPFLIQTAVATDVTARALAETLEQTRRLLQDGASEEEVAATREYLAGVMPLEMQTTEQMAGRLCEIFVYGLADDYLPQHRAALLSVTREEADAAARAHIKPEQFAITIVGDANAIESEIAALDIGPIEVHSIEH